MDVRIATSLSAVPAEREEALVKRVRELREQLLRATAVAMAAAIWFVVPIVALPGIYYMSGSAIAPLCLAGGFAVIVAVNYVLFSWMLIASEELDFERPLAIVSETPESTVAGRAFDEDLEKAVEEVHRTAA